MGTVAVVLSPLPELFEGSHSTGSAGGFAPPRTRHVVILVGRGVPPSLGGVTLHLLQRLDAEDVQPLSEHSRGKIAQHKT